MVISVPCNIADPNALAMLWMCPSLFLFLIYFSVNYVNKVSSIQICSIGWTHPRGQQIFHIFINKPRGINSFH